MDIKYFTTEQVTVICVRNIGYTRKCLHLDLNHGNMNTSYHMDKI